MSNTHFKGDTKTYYICVGKPHFSGPTKQLKAINSGAYASTSIRYINASDTLLRSRLQDHADVVINRKFRSNYERDQDRINILDTT